MSCDFQLNKDRVLMRRKPQSIKSVTPQFTADTFNFNKAMCDEHLFDVAYNGQKVSVFINNSPLTSCHSLLCPGVEENFPQILSKDTIEFAIRLMWCLDDRRFRIGYNSPGALASVNHLHLHLLLLEQTLFVEDAPLVAFSGRLYKIAPGLGVPGFCYLIDDSDASATINSEEISMIVGNFCAMNIPHNLFFTYGTRDGRRVLRVYIFPRTVYFESKDNCDFNVAFCELSGFVPVGSAEVYDALSEISILKKFREYLGNVESLEPEILKSCL